MRKRPLLWLLCGPAALALTHCATDLALGDDDGTSPPSLEAGAPDATDLEPPDRHAPPPRGLDAIQVVTGESHSCAVQSGGTVYCWGDNELGQLGIALDVAATSVPHLVELPDDLRAVQLTAGANHTCALTDRATIVCWGQNDAGQLAQPPSAVAAPAAAVMPSALATATFVSVTAGRAHTCAVYIQPQAGDAGDGDAAAHEAVWRLACWGDNGAHQLGPGIDVPYTDLPTNVSVRSLDVVVRQVALGALFSVATLRDVDGTYGVEAWGAAAEGQLAADLDGGSRAAPGVVGGGEVRGDVTAIAAGGAHACVAVRVPEPADGSDAASAGESDASDDAEAGERADAAGPRPGDLELYCWGRNDRGQVGLPATAAPAPVARVTDEVGSQASVLAGGDATCLLEHGALRCAGANDEGQLGLGAADGLAHPRFASVQGLDGLAVVSASLGARHACALVQFANDAAQVACWGDDRQGQLGDAVALGQSAPDASGSRSVRASPVFVVPPVD